MVTAIQDAQHYAAHCYWCDEQARVAHTPGEAEQLAEEAGFSWMGNGWVCFECLEATKEE